MAETHSDSHRLSNTSHLSWWCFRRQLAAQAATDIYSAIDTLFITNNRQAARRCGGKFSIIDGVPSLSYCGRWQCWKCGETRLWKERKRVLHGAAQIAAAGDLWFTTVYDSDARITLDSIDFQKRVASIVTVWRKKAQRDGVKLHYAIVYGFKKTGQIHAHILSNWLPTPRPAPTPHYPEHHRDAWLDERAAAQRLTLWHEHARSVEAVAHYSVDNLKTVLHADLPSNFHRLIYSRDSAGHTDRLWQPETVPSVTGDSLADYMIAFYGAVPGDTPIKNSTHILGTHSATPDTSHSDAPPAAGDSAYPDSATQRTARTGSAQRRAHSGLEHVEPRDNRQAYKLLRLPRLGGYHANTEHTSGRRRTVKETFDATPLIRVPP